MVAEAVLLLLPVVTLLQDPAVTVVLEDSEAILQDLEVPSHRIVPATTRHTRPTTVVPATTHITAQAIMEVTMDTVIMATVTMDTVIMDMATTTTTMDITIARIITIMAPIMDALQVAAVIIKPNKVYFLEFCIFRFRMKIR
ncbi:hypothetical protein B9Z55_008511 [Caenorhabditis nigoni]|uniref:Uncharacterized protein n=1 Tax=Caenorhabditis nigoni TaxID=1611254 RepID=A0A2G5UNU6_9PELO|nr:hypothetical protein B9Z55_008511 [Caenorhabditis nigoni]